jgi:hypothetical protein
MGEGGGVQDSYSNVQLMEELFVGEEGNVVDLFVARVYRWRKPIKEII